MVGLGGFPERNVKLVEPYTVEPGTVVVVVAVAVMKTVLVGAMIVEVEVDIEVLVV